MIKNILLLALVTLTALFIGNHTRADAAVYFIQMYEDKTGQEAKIVKTPFNDLKTQPQAVQDAVAKLYGLNITAGTTKTTFSPDERLQPYQFYIFLGKTLMRILETK